MLAVVYSGDMFQSLRLFRVIFLVLKSTRQKISVFRKGKITFLKDNAK